MMTMVSCFFADNIEERKMIYVIKAMQGVSTGDLGLPSLYKIDSGAVSPHAIIVRSSRVDTDDYPELLTVARAGAEVSNITVAKATKKGICVFNTPGANANAVAERVLAALFEVSRNIREVRRFMTSLQDIVDDKELTDIIERRKSELKGFELRGKTLAVVGLGQIGALVANMARAIGMNVIGYDAYPILENIHRLDPSVNLARSLSAAVAVADMLTVHVPYSERTKHLINREVLKKTKHGVILLNYSRGGVYDDDAVCDALDEKRVLKYVTDFPTVRLKDRKDVTCTPHLGANTEESEENCAGMAGEQLKNYLEYGVVKHSVNFPAVDLFPAPSIVTRLVVINQNIPDMIAKITNVLGRAGINITTELNQSHEIGYTLIDLETAVSPEIVQMIRGIPGVLRVRALTFSE